MSHPSVRLQGLFRTANNKRVVDFLGRDFSDVKNRTAASKNAFVLLGKHRHELAAAFFILGEMTRSMAASVAFAERHVGPGRSTAWQQQCSWLAFCVSVGACMATRTLEFMSLLGGFREEWQHRTAAVSAAQCCKSRTDSLQLGPTRKDVCM